MKQVTIVKPFTFTHDSGKMQEFKIGVHELDDDVAEHFYVKAHSNTPPFVEPQVGTPEAAKLAAQRVQRRRIIEAAMAEEADDARRRV